MKRSSFSIGPLLSNTNTFWRNQVIDSAATTLAVFLNDLRLLHIYCQRGGGGADKSPDFHISDERTYAVYEKALALTHRNPDYGKADIPFTNIIFKGAPLVADEQCVDLENSSTTITDGTWYMGNSAFMGFTYDKKKSFKMGSNIRPNNQLVTTSLMPVRGTHWVNNRRKLGVMTDIAVSTLEAATS